jgi:hypothetical protein
VVPCSISNLERVIDRQCFSGKATLKKEILSRHVREALYNVPIRTFAGGFAYDPVKRALLWCTADVLKRYLEEGDIEIFERRDLGCQDAVGTRGPFARRVRNTVRFGDELALEKGAKLTKHGLISLERATVLLFPSGNVVVRGKSGTSLLFIGKRSSTDVISPSGNVCLGVRKFNLPPKCLFGFAPSFAA